MTARQSGVRTPPEVEAKIVRLVRDGQTRGQVAKAVGVHPQTVSRVVRDAEGLEFARTGSSSSGTPEAMARARTYQSEYAKTRRNELADKLLDQIARATEMAVRESDPRKFQALMQAADAATRAYNSITKTDQAGDSGLKHGLSMLEKFTEVAVTVADLLPPVRPGLIQE